MKWIIIWRPNKSDRRLFVGPYDNQKDCYRDRDALLERFDSLTLEETGIVCVTNFEESIEWLKDEIE
jgi:hypothetical protein